MNAASTPEIPRSVVRWAGNVGYADFTDVYGAIGQAAESHSFVMTGKTKSVLFKAAEIERDREGDVMYIRYVSAEDYELIIVND